MTTPFLRRSSYALLCLLLMMSLASCGIISKDDPCGPNNHGFERFENNSLFGINEPTHTYIESGNRVYQWSTPFYENVCPEEHIDVFVNFQLATNPLLPVETRVKSDYALFFEPGIPFKEKSITGNNEFRDYKGDFGIAHAFGTDPGSFRVSVEILFNTTGDIERDHDFLLEVWINIDVTASYRDFKM